MKEAAPARRRRSIPVLRFSKNSFRITTIIINHFEGGAKYGSTEEKSIEGKT
jgi:hypothetical protein